jgi:rhodanese-related sulfurtransferase
MSYDVINILNMPLSEFDKRFTELPKNKELIMVCRGGRRSLIATDFLLNHGFTTVVNMRGGIMAWASNKLPVKN